MAIDEVTKFSLFINSRINGMLGGHLVRVCAAKAIGLLL